MFTKSLVLALAAASMASAQTFTNCNPLKKTCPADPAFGKNKVNCDLTKGPCDVFHEFDGTKLEYDERGAVFSIKEDTNAPTIGTKKFMFFGRLDVEVQPAAGAGIVTSLVLQSDDLDEIDWEWVGGDDAQAQSNYFYKGDTTTYDRGAFHPVSGAVTKVNKYSIEYTPKAVKWFINDAVVRTLTYEEAGNGAKFPQTPMEVRLGTWVGGRKDKPEGTVEWAGGLADFSKAPFNAYYKSISIVDYAGGEGPTDKDVKEYVYGDQSGTYQSIKVVLGDGSSSDDDETTTSKPTSKPTKSAEETKSSKPTSSAEDDDETKSAEPTKSTESKTTKASSTFATATTAPTTPSGTPSASGNGVSSTGSAPASGSTEDPNAPPASGASALSLGSAALVGAGLMVAQLLI